MAMAMAMEIGSNESRFGVPSRNVVHVTGTATDDAGDDEFGAL